MTARGRRARTSALFRTTLVPYDFSRHATAALRMGAGLAGPNGRVVVLHAIPPVYPIAIASPVPAADWTPAPVVGPDVVATERRRLESAVARELRGRRGPVVETRVVVADPFQAIVGAARRATAIVMGTLGRTGLAHLVLGSVAEKVVRHAPVPVLTVRVGGRRRSRA